MGYMTVIFALATTFIATSIQVNGVSLITIITAYLVDFFDLVNKYIIHRDSPGKSAPFNEFFEWIKLVQEDQLLIPLTHLILQWFW